MKRHTERHFLEGLDERTERDRMDGAQLGHLARERLEWNDVLPDLRVQEFTPPGHATQLFGVVADYGWAERILFSDAREQDAEAIRAALLAVCKGPA